MTDPQDPFAAPGDQPPQQPPQAPPPGYGTPPQGYGAPPPGYGQPPAYGAAPGYGPPATERTNTLAIIGLIAAFFCGLAGVVMGIIARSQIKQRGERGDGLAIAAIVVGALNILIGIALATSG